MSSIILLISFFEGKKKVKFNSILEVYLIIPFVFVLTLILFQFKNLVFISFVLLAKEIVLIFFRVNKIKHVIDNIMIININIFLVVLSMFVSIYFDSYFYLSFLILILTNFGLLKLNFGLGVAVPLPVLPSLNFSMIY